MTTRVVCMSDRGKPKQTRDRREEDRKTGTGAAASHPISRPRPRLVQASASLPTLLRSFGGTGGRCSRAVLERECLNDSSEFINDLDAPACPIPRIVLERSPASRIDDLRASQRRHIAFGDVYLVGLPNAGLATNKVKEIARSNTVPVQQMFSNLCTEITLNTSDTELPSATWARSTCCSTRSVSPGVVSA